MRRYDTNCESCGVLETTATVKEAADGALRCASCGNFAPQHFGPANIPQMRVESAGEDSRDPARVADGTEKFNLGLRGVDTPIGKRPDGRPRLAYRPLTNHEAGSNRKIREIAKRQGLTPAYNGAYRPIGGR